MRAEVLALAAAFCFGTNNFLMGIGLRHASAATGATISVLFNALFLWIFFWYVGLHSGWLWVSAALFVLGGCCAPGVARLFNFIGFQRIGAANSVSLAAASPVYAAILAVIFLREHITFSIGLGTVCVVTGSIIISRTSQARSGWQRRDIMWPLMAGILFALRDTLVRYGLRDYHEPVLAASLTVTTSFVMLLAWQSFSGDIRSFNPSRRNLPFFLIAAAFVTGSYVFMFSAFSVGQVVTVSPLVAAHPLITIGLTVIFLRKTEVVTWRTIFGALLIILGAVVIGVGNQLLSSLKQL